MKRYKIFFILKLQQWANQVFKKLQGVGKSCILNRYVQNEYTNNYKNTLGVAILNKTITIKENIKIKLQLWDTAGQETFKSIIRSFYRNTSAVLLIYDVTDYDSFSNLLGWYQEAKSNLSEETIFVLIGNKQDEESQRKVSYIEGQQFMNQNNMHLFYETSAKSNQNIDQAFQQTSIQIYANLQKEKQSQTQDNPKSIYLNKSMKKNKKKGC